ncbi:hypothetical protein PAMC26510_15015 [Caballeronia sordidicola]|uniref:Uncharacterized protein n=1 Tax=Caballeronia sordidicola TaxID=196367 RepID=A0A242MUY8_CABSO|nr:hypothetical protein PAMC26510_15015 [Caballeronia sordidicola]
MNARLLEQDIAPDAATLGATQRFFDEIDCDRPAFIMFAAGCF